MSFI
jgi:hypothetical protein